MENQKVNKIDPILNLEKDSLKVQFNKLIHRAIHIMHDHSNMLLDDDPSNDSDGIQCVLSDLEEVYKLVRCRMNF